MIKKMENQKAIETRFRKEVNLPKILQIFASD